MKKLLLLAGAIAIAGVSTAQIHLSEDFEGGAMPSGWAQTTNATDGGWNFGAAGALGSTYFPFAGNNTKFAGTNDDACNCDKSADFLYTSSVDLTGVSGPVYMKYKQYYFAGNYQGAQEIGTIKASLDGGATWTTFVQMTPAPEWGTVTYNMSSLAGTNVMIGFEYNDGAGWTFGMGIDDLVIYEPDNEDFVLAAIDLPNYAKLSNGPVAIKGTVNNNGGVAITTMDVEYTINGGSPVTANLTGLNVAPLTSYDFTHSTPWAPTTDGSYTVEIKITAVNGNPDSDITDNVLSQDVVVYTNSYPRVVLYEMFTSSTCAPCKPGNENFEQVVSGIADSEYSSIKYQMSWPAPGDPYNTADGNSRRQYYNVSGVPNLEIDGGWGGNSGSFTMTEHNAAMEVPAFVEIDAEYSVNGNLVRACATMKAMQDLGGATLQFAIIEGKTVQNVGNNGETEFFDVVKKMMPDASGQSVTITNGMNSMVCEEWEFQGNFRLPNNAGDLIDDSMEHSVEEFSDLKVVVWLEANKVVLNSTRATSGITSVSNVVATQNNVSIYPNPAVDNATVSIQANDATVANVKVMDMVGKTVLEMNNVNVNSGSTTIELNTANFNAGVYMLVVTMDGNVSTKQLVIQK